MKTKPHYDLPHAGTARERLRVKGQFWTPAWIAEAMAEYVLNGLQDEAKVFDPAIGEGAFLRAVKSVAGQHGQKVTLAGYELDEARLAEAQASGLTSDDLRNVELRDFALNPPCEKFKAIIANPPYIRHHRLAAEAKYTLRSYGTNLLGAPIDGRAGIHIYFLLRALEMLEAGGRLAFIMPADTCEGVFAGRLWRWIAKRFRLDAVVTFAADASPFPRIDTNPIIFFIRCHEPQAKLVWAQCTKAETHELKQWTRSGFSITAETIDVQHVAVDEAIERGLSRAPVADDEATNGVPLANFARVMRGIATGANEFFFLTESQTRKLALPHDFLRRAVGRTRDCPRDVFDFQDLHRLEEQGRPTWLLSLDGSEIKDFPLSVREYLRAGEASELPQRALIKTRRPWYKMEQRSVPPILFAYLGRRNARFIINAAGVLPLTSFLCVYPHDDSNAAVRNLCRALNDARTLANLNRVAKSYGNGAMKVEPRALERLLLPLGVLLECGLTDSRNAPHKSYISSKGTEQKVLFTV